MAGLPEEIRKKLSEGSPLTPEETKQVAEHVAAQERETEFQKNEARQAFKDRDEAKRKAREAEEAEAARKRAEETEVERLKREKAEAEQKLAAEKADAEAHRQYRAAKIEEHKKAFGDAWDDSYAQLSLQALDKLAATVTGKKPGTPPPAGVGSEAPKDYGEYLRNPSRFGEWGEKNREQLNRLKADWQAKRRG